MAMSTRASRSFNVMLASRSLGIVTVISTMKVAQKAKFGKPPDFGVAVIFLWQRQIEKRWPTMRKKANVRTAFLHCLSAPLCWTPRRPQEFWSGHQNGHQTAQKRYDLIKEVLLEPPIKSGIFDAQRREKKADSDLRLQIVTE